MSKGRWYPHTIELLDGRMIIFGGFIGINNCNVTGNMMDMPYGNYSCDMYPFEINKGIDIFTYDSSNPSASTIEYVNLSLIPNSPFQTRLSEFPPIVTDPDIDCIPRQCNDYKNDTFKLYPNNYLLPNSSEIKIYLTREGDWNSLRNDDASCIRRTKTTYFMTLHDDNSVTFEYGPDRPFDVTMSGTTVLDPNYDNEKINLFGGMKIKTGGTMLPITQSSDDDDVQIPKYGTTYAGSRGTRQFLQYSINDNVWNTVSETYMGDTLEYDRTMHYATILPTKEILITNGGNYDFSKPVFAPLLLSPVYYDNGTFSGEYNKKYLTNANQPRLYHNGAMLLSDGRIIVYGGNAARASIDINADLDAEYPKWSTQGQPKPNIYGSIDVNINFFRDGYYSSGVVHDAPAENWNMEIFNPPYMFIDSNCEIAMMYSVNSVSYSYVKTNEFDGKDYYLIHSNDTFNIQLNNVSNCDDDDDIDATSNSLVLIKLGSSTHGWDQGQRLYDLEYDWINDDLIEFVVPYYKEYSIVPAFYHLFFVDCKGKPTKSIMVRFDDQASAPY